MPSLFERAATALIQGRSGDGFGPTPGADPEPEPTALAAIALDDDDARRWLLGAQRADGSFGIRGADIDSDAATALCALALPPGAERERALDHVVLHSAQTVPSGHFNLHDDSVSGWAWTVGTAGWVEPTARALLALRRLRPQATEAIEEGIAYLRDRECIDGGWNYGNRLVYGVELPAFGQTTAIALIGLHGSEPTPDLIDRGVYALRRLWPRERSALTLATSLAAFLLLGLPDAEDVEVELAGVLDEPPNDVVTLAWTTLASGPGLAALAVNP